MPSHMCNNQAGIACTRLKHSSEEPILPRSRSLQSRRSQFSRLINKAAVWHASTTSSCHEAGRRRNGAVYKARQVSLDRIAALKILAKRLVGDTSFVTRFLREARATAKLNQPNIVSGIAVGSADGYHYFAMEFIEGDTLNKRLKTNGPIAEAEALRIGAALAHAHSIGIVHRDVKPDNILITSDGTPARPTSKSARREVSSAASRCEYTQS